MRQRISFCTTSDGVRIAYAIAGNGPPLIRVGGWLTHVERDWDSPVWQHWLREFANRQRVVLDRVARGQSNTQIAQTLSIAAKTVRNHVSAICGKLDISSRAQLIVQAREKGFGAD